MIEKKIAKVNAIFPSRVGITIYDLDAFQLGDESLRVGSYLRIIDSEDAVMIAMVESFSIGDGVPDQNGVVKPSYSIDARPLGTIKNGTFERGSTAIAIPPKFVEPAKREEVRAIFEEAFPEQVQFLFSHLASDPSIKVPVEGNRFFNKHVAVVGSTGSGKSYTVSKLLQTAIHAQNGRNNAHVVIFDIHSEYHAAFPDANYMDISNLVIPYWLMNGTELQEFFLDTEGNDWNQRNVFKEGVLNSKREYYRGSDEQRARLTLDSPVFFEVEDILKYAIEKNGEYVEGASGRPKQGPLYGRLSNYINRLETKIHDKRLTFMLGEKAKESSFDDVLHQLTGYGEKESNITIVDVSGVPFEVLSITVSLISRIIFDYCYFTKRLRTKLRETITNNTPFLMVYEEAHKYVPNSTTAKYRSARESIERIAKEGRKYGVSLMLASQRPSEISETVFSQCSSFLALRLTNAADQNYVKRLLPDAMGNIVESLPVLRTGECLLVGESVALPCIVRIDSTSTPPASDDIPYWTLWKEPWNGMNIDAIRSLWMDQ